MSTGSDYYFKQTNFFSRIIGTGSFLPRNRLSNDDLALWLKKKHGIDTNNDWIEGRTGIKKRYFADPGEMTSDLAEKAAISAISAAQIDTQSIDLIIVATSTPDHVFPSTACFLQKKLAIKNCCAAFDVQAVCSGFVYAMTVANAMLKSGVCRRALVVGAEIFSRLLDYSDRSTCVLFGDGAGAVILEASDEPGILANVLHADGQYAEILKASGSLSQLNQSPITDIYYNDALKAKDLGFYVRMDGRQVFKLAVSVLNSVAREVLDLAGMAAAEINWLIPHQANLRIMESLCSKLGLPLEKMVVTVSEHANTSAASIPMALDVAVRDGRIQREHHILLEGVGGGLTWGAVILRF